MTPWFGFTALLVACILLDVRHTRHLDRVARRERRHR